MTASHTRSALTAAASERILIIDGAMGTQIQERHLSPADFAPPGMAEHAEALAGNNDLLVLSRPDIVTDVHADYLAAGADIICTNTFSSTAVAQAEYGLAHLVPELNRESARIARRVADEAATPDRPRFVAGSIGPTNVTLSMSPRVEDPGYRALDFATLADAYAEVGRTTDAIRVYRDCEARTEDDVQRRRVADKLSQLEARAKTETPGI